MKTPTKLACSFCGKDESKVAKLVAGPKVFICDECVKMAAQIMKDSGDPPSSPEPKVDDFRKILSRFRLTRALTTV